MDFAAFLRLLGKRRWVLVGFALAAAAVAFALSSLQEDRYEASAELLFRQEQLVQGVFGAEPSRDGRPPERQAATNLALASLDSVAASVKRRLNRPESVSELRDKLEVSAKGESDIVTVTAEAGDAREAASLANTFAREVVANRRAAGRADLRAGIKAVERQLRDENLTRDVALGLRRRQRQLETLERVQTGGVEVAQAARPPDDRSAPRPVRNTIAAALAALLLGIALVVLRDRLDRRVRGEEQMAALIGAPILTRLPSSLRRVGRDRQEALFREAFQFLRSNLQLLDREHTTRTIAVVSALPQDGKTTVVWGLAKALALSGHRVTTVDCDLRKPMLHNVAGAEQGDGVTQALTGLRAAADLVERTATPNVRLLPAGPSLPVHPSALIEPTRLRRLLDDLRPEADYLLVDTAPLTVAADASVVASCVDGVIFVADMTRASAAVIEGARDQLSKGGGRLLGVVLNRTEVPESGYYYDYYGPSNGSRPSRGRRGSGRQAGESAPR